jgi:hypothetical protein
MVSHRRAGAWLLQRAASRGPRQLHPPRYVMFGPCFPPFRICTSEKIRERERGVPGRRQRFKAPVSRSSASGEEARPGEYIRHSAVRRCGAHHGDAVQGHEPREHRRLADATRGSTSPGSAGTRATATASRGSSWRRSWPCSRARRALPRCGSCSAC